MLKLLALMKFAIDLDDQSPAMTIKVRHIHTHRMLRAKRKPIEFVPFEQRPHHLLRRRQLFAQLNRQPLRRYSRPSLQLVFTMPNHKTNLPKRTNHASSQCLPRPAGKVATAKPGSDGVFCHPHATKETPSVSLRSPPPPQGGEGTKTNTKTRDKKRLLAPRASPLPQRGCRGNLPCTCELIPLKIHWQP